MIVCQLCTKTFPEDPKDFYPDFYGGADFDKHMQEEHPDYPPLSYNAQQRIADLEHQLAELTRRLDAMEAGK
jgi:hypothetical protein